MSQRTAAAAASDAAHAGIYLYRITDDFWWWSPEIYAIHGFTPGEVTPSLDLLLDQKHPEDREHVHRLFKDCMADGEPFSSYHRIIDQDRRERRVVLAGDGYRGNGGDVTMIRGFLIDLTVPVTQDIRETSDHTIAAARASQAAIDQARGILMGIYGVDADTAFAILCRQSQHTNIKLRDLARSLVAATPAPPGSPRVSLRRRLETVLYPGTGAASRQ